MNLYDEARSEFEGGSSTSDRRKAMTISSCKRKTAEAMSKMKPGKREYADVDSEIFVVEGWLH